MSVAVPSVESVETIRELGGTWALFLVWRVMKLCQ